MSDESVVRPSGLEKLTDGLQYVGAMPAGEADAEFHGKKFRLFARHPDREAWMQFIILNVKETGDDDKDVFSVAWEKQLGTMHEDTEVHVFSVLPALPVLEDEDDGGETEPVETEAYAPELVEKAEELAGGILYSSDEILLIHDAMKADFEQAGISGLKTEPVVEETATPRLFKKAQEVAYLKRCAENAPKDSYIRMLLSDELLARFEADVQSDGVPDYYKQLYDAVNVANKLHSQLDSLLQAVRVAKSYTTAYDIALTVKGIDLSMYADESDVVHKTDDNTLTDVINEKDAEIARLTREIEGLKADRQTQADVIKKHQETEREVNESNRVLTVALSGERSSHAKTKSKLASVQRDVTALKAEKFDSLISLNKQAEEAGVLRRWSTKLILNVSVPDTYLDELEVSCPALSHEVESARGKNSLLKAEDMPYKEKFNTLGYSLTNAIATNRIQGDAIVEISPLLPRGIVPRHCIRCEKPIDPESDDGSFCSDTCSQLFGMP